MSQYESCQQGEGSPATNGETTMNALNTSKPANDTSTRDLDVAQVAKLIRAAYKAARDTQRIGMEHIVAAAEAECRAAGKLFRGLKKDDD